MKKIHKGNKRHKKKKELEITLEKPPDYLIIILLDNKMQKLR